MVDGYCSYTIKYIGDYIYLFDCICVKNQYFVFFYIYQASICEEKKIKLGFKIFTKCSGQDKALEIMLYFDVY